MKTHKHPLTLRPEPNIEIRLEEQCPHCKGTDINVLTGEKPCPECAHGYRLTDDGEKLLQFMYENRYYLKPPFSF